MRSPDPVTMQHLKPAANRLTVIESDANEETRESGLIIPTLDKDSHLRRGVIIDAGPCTDSIYRLEAGWVVFFRHGTKIGDVSVVDVQDVVAYIEEGI